MTALKCPCCGGSVAAETPIDQACRLLPPLMAGILRAVAAKPNISMKKLAYEVYKNAPNGGPVSANNVITQTIARSEKLLPIWGFEIKRPGRSGPRRGYSLVFLGDE